MRTRAAQSGRVAGRRNVVSERFISRAIDCISASVNPAASNTTARGLPPKMRSVNTSTWANLYSRRVVMRALRPPAEPRPERTPSPSPGIDDRPRSSRWRPVPSPLQLLEDPVAREGHRVDFHAVLGQRVLDGIRDGGRGGDGAALAHALDAQGIHRRRK